MAARLGEKNDGMTDSRRISAGMLQNCLSEEIHVHRVAAVNLCYDLNRTKPSDLTARERILDKLLPNADCPRVASPFHCEFGFNIYAKRGLVIENDLLVFDFAPVTFGENVHVGAGCTFVTSFHPMAPSKRDTDVAFALPITIGDNVVFGEGVKVIGGVTIGDNASIGAGSVVTKDIPSDCYAVGSPCKVVRRL